MFFANFFAANQLKKNIRLSNQYSVGSDSITISDKNDLYSTDLLKDIEQRSIFKIIIKVNTIRKYESYPFNRMIREIVFDSTTITEITSGVFYQCVFLEKVTLSPSITKIGGGCFAFSSINSINLENVIFMENQAFLGCSKLTSINISKSKSVFFQNSGLTSVVFGDSIQLITQSSFSYCKHLKHVKLGKNTIEIGFGAFQYCPSLIDFDYGESKLKSISSYSFQGCTIEKFIVKNSIESLEYRCFANSKIKEVIFEERSNDIVFAEGIFDFCNNLEKISFPSSNTNFQVTLGTSTFTKCDNLKEFVCYAKVDFIPNNCFEKCTSLLKVIVPSASIINEQAFYKCHSLEIVQFSNDLLRIEKEAFRYCYNLELLPDTRQMSIGEKSFYCCEKLKFNLLPIEFTINGDAAFMYCDNINELVIESVFTNIQIFSSCINLKKVTLKGSNIESIPAQTFSGCINLKTIVFPDTITKIGEYAFFFCDLSTGIALNNVRELNQYAFAYSNVTSVTINSDIDFNSKTSNCFLECKSLKEIVLTKNVKTFSFGLFPRCYSLENIKLVENTRFKFSNGILTTENSHTLVAYLSTNKNKKYKIPNEMTTISPYAFNSQTHLKTITIDHQVIIGAGAFFSMPNLENFEYLDSKQLVLLDSTFANCSKLEIIESKAPIINIGSDCFYNCSSLVDFDTKSVEFIGDRAFERCISLKSLNLSSCRKISENSFFGCKKLKEITFSKNLTSIGEQCFSWVAIKNIRIESNFHYSIESHAFSYCDKLESVYLGPGITELKETTFAFTSLKKIILPETITKISATAFLCITNSFEVEIDPRNPIFVSTKNGVLNKNTKALVVSTFYDKKAILPNETVFIDDNTVLNGLDANERFFSIRSEGAPIVEVPPSVLHIESGGLIQSQYLYSLCIEGNQLIYDELIKFDYTTYVKDSYKYPMFMGMVPNFKECGSEPYYANSQFRGVFGLKKKELFLVIAISIVSGAFIAFLVYFLVVYKQICKKSEKKQKVDMFDINSSE